MFKIAIQTDRSLQFYITKDGLEEYVRATRPGQIFFTESLNRGLTYLHKDRLVRITELHNPIVPESPESLSADEHPAPANPITEEPKTPEPVTENRSDREQENPAQETAGDAQVAEGNIPVTEKPSEKHEPLSVPAERPKRRRGRISRNHPMLQYPGKPNS